MIFYENLFYPAKTRNVSCLARLWLCRVTTNAGYVCMIRVSFLLIFKTKSYDRINCLSAMIGMEHVCCIMI